MLSYHYTHQWCFLYTHRAVFHRNASKYSKTSPRFFKYFNLILPRILTISDAMSYKLRFNKLVTCIIFIFTREALPPRGYSTPSTALHIRVFTVPICCENLPWLFAARICRGNMPQEFAVAICRRNLQWLFAVRICRGSFCIRKQILFLYVSKSCYMKANLFYTWAKLFICDFFYFLTVFLFVIVVTVMGHRTNTLNTL